MESRVNYIIVGFFVIILGIGMGVTALWLTTRGQVRNFNTYLIYMNEAASGLNEQAAVKFNGVEVGYVDRIRLNPADPRQVKLVLKIDSTAPISTSTVATLISQGITGITHVGLKATDARGQPLLLKEGEDFPIIAYKPSLFTEIDSAIRDISGRFKEISEQLSKLFTDENATALSEVLTDFRTIMQTLAENNQRIDNTLRNTDKLLANLSESSEQLPEASKRLNASLKEAETALQTVSQETLPVANVILQRFERSASNLEQLSIELARNPSVLLRGRQPSDPGPGERALQ